MRLSHRKRVVEEAGLELPMTGMIDVVFLLLIFFLITTTFFRPERQIAAAIQVDNQDAGQRQSYLEPAWVDVTMADGKAVYRLGANTTSDLNQLKNLLKQFGNKSEGAFVRVAPDVPFDYTAKTIGVCKSAGFQTVSYISTE